MVNGVLSTADLLEATSYESVGALKRSLDQQGVPYYLGRDGAPWTTINLLESAKLQIKPEGRDSFSLETL